MCAKNINKLIVFISIALLSTTAFSDEKSKQKKHDNEKRVKIFKSQGGKKATQAALDEEVANRIAADQSLQNNINTISLTPGPQGVAGAKGEKGDQGIQGIQGVAGVNGEPGIQGVQGEIGLTGAKGEKGDQGIQGIPGVAGTKGDKGDQGVAGVNGSNGAAGADGTSCAAIQGDGSATISCEDGSMASVYDGKTASARSTQYVTGIGPQINGVNYFPPGRLLIINKQSETSDLRISSTDVLWTMGSFCRKEILIDGEPCPSGAIKFVQYSRYDSHMPKTLVGYCKGITAGQHEIKVRISLVSGHSYCYSGRAAPLDSTFLLESEEVN